ncbi:MAG TPA: polysaccharide biosynthesis/export family protein [Steroidobacteraceae bacterium]|nr:polysaccharide biosynthesis/export family protein [Steroidobacteraceae bacterium]
MQYLVCVTLALAAAGAAVAGASPGPLAPPATAPGSTPPAVVPESPPAEYLVQAGDVLTVTVWKEQDLTGDVLVRPDGGLSFPLVGDLVARGKTVEELRKEITERLVRYVPSPVVTVAVKQVGGNHIYVVGKVQRPGEYPIVRSVDVMQALSLAGGATPYAALNSIVILHRENGRQQAFHFRYSEVARGRDLSQNILLQSGDTVVVP